MKETIVHPFPDIWSEIHDVPIPEPRPNEVVIKVFVAGSNVKDWLHPTVQNISLNSGDDIAGTVYKLGKEVASNNQFHINDRVAAFHPMLTPHGAFAEYAIAPSHTVFKLPENTSFYSAATIPLVVATAGLTLFRRQFLPPPWSPRSPSSEPIPLIVYGAGSALGAFAIKLAKIANIHPIIAIAGSSTSHILPLLDESLGDALVDYRNGVEAMKTAVAKALGGLPAHHALDAISGSNIKAWIPLSQMLTPGTSEKKSYVSVVSGSYVTGSPDIKAYEEEGISPGVDIVYTNVGTMHWGAYKEGAPKTPKDKEFVKGDMEWGYVFFKYVERLLADGRLEGHPYEVAGGLESVGEGLKRLKEGRASGVKLVYTITNE